MKRFLPILLAILLVFSGCSMQSDNKKDDGKLKITATIFPTYDFLREITAGVDVELNMLIAPGMEVHGFETTLEDIAMISSSDLFVYVGGEDDEWVKDITSDETWFLGLNTIIETTEDDHIWTSPENAITITQMLCQNLCDIDPGNAEIYKANTDKYIKELNNLDKSFAEAIENGKTNTVVFAERFPFYHLAKDYGLGYYSAFEGCSTETEAGIKTINFLIEKVKEENIPAIFTIEFSDGTVAETISNETGAEILQFHSCHNVTEEEFKKGETYISLMQNNLKNLEIALDNQNTGA